MIARQGTLSSSLFGEDLNKLFPIITPDGSDTSSIDNAIEFLLATGRSLPHVMMMLIPEAWGDHLPMDKAKRDFYEYHSFLMEPWDGPALIAFTDGKRVGAILDRNGLRPFRYVVTQDDLLVMASEVGVLDIPPESILYKGRIRPGRMFLLDPEEGGIIEDGALKDRISRRQPYGEWLDSNRVRLDEIPNENLPQQHLLDGVARVKQQKACL